MSICYATGAHHIGITKILIDLNRTERKQTLGTYLLICLCEIFWVLILWERNVDSKHHTLIIGSRFALFQLVLVSSAPKQSPKCHYLINKARKTHFIAFKKNANLLVFRCCTFFLLKKANSSYLFQ